MADANRSHQRTGIFDLFTHDKGAGLNTESDNESDFDLPSGDDDSDYHLSDDAASDEGSNSDGDTDNCQIQDGGAHGQVGNQQNDHQNRGNNWNVVQPPEVIDRSNIPEFTVRHVGPKNSPQRNSDPIAYFSLFFDDDMFIHIVRETNKYANFFLNDDNIVEWIENHPTSRFKKWPENGIGVVDMKKFLGLSINMGLIRKSKLASYWTVSKPSQLTPYFNLVMSQNFFLLLSRMFHVNDSTKEPRRGEPDYDPWYKVRPVLDRLNHAFKKFYVPTREISIDESMIGMKNRCVFIQYMPNKRHARFGIKKFELCDTNGYVCHVELYAGKDLDVNYDDGQAHGVVMKLIDVCNLFNKGYHLFTDNFYTKPKLADDLFEQKTLLTGTVRSNSKGLPANIAGAGLGVGETLYARCDNILAVRFREKKSQKKPVILLSTYHVAENLEKEIRGKLKSKPAMVFHYNQHMGGVDISDKKVCHIAAERPTHRFWIKIFRNLLDIAILNAYEVYKLNTDKDKILDKHDFVVSIVETLCGATVNQGAENIPLRAHVVQHRLVLLEDRKERDCVVCSNRYGGGTRKRSRHWCPGCGVGCHERCEIELEHYRRPARVGRKRRAAAEADGGDGDH